MLGLVSFQSPLVVCRVKISEVKPSMKVRNGSFMPLKCTKREIVRAEVRIDDHERGETQRVCPEITIQEIPYVDEVVKRLSKNSDAFRKTESHHLYLEEAYERCRMFCANEKLMMSVARQLTKERAQALWAIFAWGRRIDDFIDSANDESLRSAYLDQWEERTNDIINGRPHDILDAALVDTISKFQIDTALFKDVLKGLRMDITKKQYANFEELFLYCYYVTGSVGLMMFQIVGFAPESTMSSETIYDGGVYFALAIQLTNILQDVSEDAQLGRIYLPQDELAHFGLCDEDIFSRKVTDAWKEFMKFQIQRVRFYYDLGEQGISQLDKASRSKLLSGMMVYKHILDIIEEKDYDNLTETVKYSVSSG